MFSTGSINMPMFKSALKRRIGSGPLDGGMPRPQMPQRDPGSGGGIPSSIAGLKPNYDGGYGGDKTPVTGGPMPVRAPYDGGGYTPNTDPNIGQKYVGMPQPEMGPENDAGVVRGPGMAAAQPDPLKIKRGMGMPIRSGGFK